MSFKWKDAIGLSALLFGLIMGADLSKTNADLKKTTIENQQNLGQPFLSKVVPNELREDPQGFSLEVQPQVKKNKSKSQRKVAKNAGR